MAQSQRLNDNRSRAHGLPGIFIWALTLGGVVLVWRAIAATTSEFVGGQYLWAVTSVLAALVWVAGCAGMVHNGRRMRRLAFAAWILNLVGAALGLGLPELFVRTNPWFAGGATYFYLPTIGGVLALIWLVWSRPAAVAARQMDDARRDG